MVLSTKQTLRVTSDEFDDPSQWLTLLVLAWRSSRRSSGWRSGRWARCCRSRVLLGAIAGVLLAPHHRQPHRRLARKLFTALFLILRGLVVSARSPAWCWAARSAVRSAAQLSA